MEISDHTSSSVFLDLDLVVWVAMEQFVCIVDIINRIRIIFDDIMISNVWSSPTFAARQFCAVRQRSRSNILAKHPITAVCPVSSQSCLLEGVVRLIHRTPRSPPPPSCNESSFVPNTSKENHIYRQKKVKI